jgi:hypothetical protein
MPGTTAQYATAAQIRAGQVKTTRVPTAAQAAWIATLHRQPSARSSAVALLHSGNPFYGPPAGTTPAQAQQNGNLAGASNPAPADTTAPLVGVDPVTNQFANLLNLTEM